MDNHVAHLESRRSGNRLRIALFIVIGMMVVEVIGGLVSGSLALLGDAGHMLVDALALTMSLIAIRLARRPATPTKTYGYHRVEIMAAFGNGLVLLITTAVIFYEAYQRLFTPPEISTGLMLIVAGLGLAANVVGIRLLRSGSKESLNIEGAFWHVVGDAISSVGVIIAGIIIIFTGWYIVDPIIAMVIGVIILWGAVRLVRESTNILLESVPRHIVAGDVQSSIRGVPGVKDLHDMHIWTITSGIYAMSAHLIIDDQTVSRSEDILRAVNQNLAEKYNITHTTLQIECQTCEAGCVCNLTSGHIK